MSLRAGNGRAIVDSGHKSGARMVAGIIRWQSPNGKIKLRFFERLEVYRDGKVTILFTLYGPDARKLKLPTRWPVLELPVQQVELRWQQ